MSKSSPAFTLIELLVVIAIISLLASIVFFSVSSAKAKARDAQKISEVGQVQTALELYYEKNGTMPPNYTCSGTTLASCTITSNVNAVSGSMQQNVLAYEASMNQLVQQGDLASIPANLDQSYSYYNYGTDTPVGAVFSATLDVTNPANVTGPQCRIKNITSQSLYPNLPSSDIVLYPTWEMNSDPCIMGLPCRGFAEGGTYGISFVNNQNVTESCTWGWEETSSTPGPIITSITGNYCGPVKAAQQCSGNNVCTCNPY